MVSMIAVPVSCMATVCFVTCVVLAFVPVTIVFGVVMVHLVISLWMLGTHTGFLLRGRSC